MGHDEGLRMWDWPVVQASNHEWICDTPFAEIHIGSNADNTTYWADVAFKGRELGSVMIERNYYKSLRGALQHAREEIEALFRLARQFKHLVV